MSWALTAAAVLVAALSAAGSGIAASLQALVDAAPAGSEVVVRGVVRGPVVIRKPLRLVGEAGAVVDGGGQGTVVRVEAPYVYVARLALRNSGSELNTEDAGVFVGAPGVVLEDLVLEDVLFGLNLKQAHRAVVRRVRMSGKPLPLNRRGDGVRLWYSQRVTLTDVQVEGMRDVLLWFTEDSVLHRLRVRGSRYGVHYMYAHRTPLLDSTLEGNAVGAYIMYSTGVRVEGNRFLHNRDVPGVGLAFKESDAVVVRRNAVVGNHVGLYLDATPMGGDGRGRFEDNVVAGNGVGAVLLSNVTGNTFTGNVFEANGETVRTEGGANARNRWWESGRGNWWDGYAGLDLNGDGVGDYPYRLRRWFESVADTVPTSRVLHGSAAVAALERAAQAVPLFPPHVVVEDQYPLVRAPVPAEFLHTERSGAFAAASAAVAAVGVTGIWLAARRRAWEVRL
ncbi:MAG: nitrous oxide reductase family maturation protein NosD [Armatimonadota bacterium]|nr:nitrous oxide reductase family maturation protein NosD [Armatimonadota bacterium]MDR7386516.1 nitrous oxide reductase family maturation protein NosD [Armatimonadota bacterium]MDR7395345.1 nitrous oxide reductase family maturation protein NosD [Armatimonadota bacterium]MDR7406336.1 nitrous oxide reductase family maturation protein NosD [Armatimonadota bacterium]MDR7414255.1 nitrous oxide reductase family maturation protein NosD [Armatimonadota bacterium]